ncbi:dTDP-4-dehydrorhamnose 3,5-epimerase [Sulfurimonas sp.]|uniref:dTDP-4-dehydrorhamnose 3,5-epimerase n=1 Tax=Sulfurimonas sp. TaxID=2022749 RepID=UPI003562FD01
MDKKLNIISTYLDGLFVIEPNKFIDDRGSFSRVYCEEELKEISNISIKQINHSISRSKGTVRGMHFQYEPNAEVKMVKCVKGKVFDVVIDIRKDSPTFLKTFSIELTDENQKMIYIPKGFAHGFQTLEDNTELLYLHSTIYIPSNEGALNVTDPLLNIKWPLDIINLSKRDNEHRFLDNDFKGIEINEL